MPSPSREVREFHRIRFPISERPTFLHEDRSYPVIDVSIRGFCYSASGGPVPEPQDSIKGILRFRRGAEVEIDGTVVRVQREEVALHLAEEIPFAVLLAEQRYLHKHYPAWS